MRLSGTAEHTYFKAIEGNDSYYTVQKAWRLKPAREDFEEGTRYLSRVRICDTREPADHPCPKGVGPQ